MESTPEYRASVYIWQYSPPFLFVFGTFGSMVTVAILRRMNMKRSSMPIYLTALAVSDTFLLYVGLLRHWIMHVFGVDLRTLHSVVCKLHVWLVYSLIITSAWILTFMTVERSLSVCRPHRVSLMCTRTRAGVIIVIIITVSMLVNSHLLYGVDLAVLQNGTSVVCSSPDPHYLYFFGAVWSWVDLTLASIIPFIILLIGNCLILWKVSLSAQAATSLGSARPSVTLRKKRVSSMTITLIGLSVIFFLTTTPICVYNVVEHYVKKDFLGDPRGTGRLRLTWAIVNILMYTNNSVNFYLYCLSGTKFRRELRRCLCHWKDARPSSSRNADVYVMTNRSNNRTNRTNLNHDTHDNNHHRHHHHCRHHHGFHEQCAHCQTRPAVEDKDHPDGLLLGSDMSTVSDSSTEF